MVFYILIFLYSSFLLWFGVLFSQYKVSLYTSAYIIYTLLIGIPFFIIFAEVQDIFYISKIIDRGLEAKVTLHLNDGIRPITYLLIFNFIYLSIGTIGLFKFKKTHILKHKIDIEYANKVYRLIKVSLFITFSYIFIRYIFYPDFPLFVLLKHGFSNDFVLRDLAFSYGHNHNVPYIFLPSINSQFYRILLPVSFFTLLYYYQNYKTSYSTKVLLIFTLVMVIALNFGTFKRTPILYLSTWFILYLYMYIDDLKALAKIFLFVIFTIIVLVLITALYSDKDAHTIILNILARFAVGEAIGEFLAIEHFGTTFEYMNFDILTLYMQKVMGMDVQTFSEIWKIWTGGTRGYTSIGVIAEFIVSFGYLSIIYFVFFTASLIQLDIFFKANSNSFNRPIIAGLITVISYMMVKGFFAQLFTGGVIVLIFTYVIIKIYTTDSVDIVKNKIPI